MIVTLKDGTKQNWPVGSPTLGYEIVSAEITAQDVSRCKTNAEVDAMVMWFCHAVLTRFSPE